MAMAEAGKATLVLRNIFDAYRDNHKGRLCDPKAGFECLPE
jgi:hypothetical protein